MIDFLTSCIDFLCWLALTYAASLAIVIVVIAVVHCLLGLAARILGTSDTPNHRRRNMLPFFSAISTSDQPTPDRLKLPAAVVPWCMLVLCWALGGIVTRMMIVGDTTATQSPACPVAGTLAVDYGKGIAAEYRDGRGWVDLPPRESVPADDQKMWPMLFQADHRDEEPYRSARLRWVDAYERKRAGGTAPAGQR